MNRRDFLKSVSGVVAGLPLAGLLTEKQLPKMHTGGVVSGTGTSISFCSLSHSGGVVSIVKPCLHLEYSGEMVLPRNSWEKWQSGDYVLSSDGLISCKRESKESFIIVYG